MAGKSPVVVNEEQRAALAELSQSRESYAGIWVTTA